MYFKRSWVQEIFRYFFIIIFSLQVLFFFQFELPLKVRLCFGHLGWAYCLVIHKFFSNWFFFLSQLVLFSCCFLRENILRQFKWCDHGQESTENEINVWFLDFLSEKLKIDAIFKSFFPSIVIFHNCFVL